MNLTIVARGKLLNKAIEHKKVTPHKPFPPGVCKYYRGKWFWGHKCKHYQQVNVMAGVSEEVVPEQGERFNHPITISYPFTHNFPKDIMLADLDWSIDDKQVRHFTGFGNTPMVYPLKPVIEEIQKSAEETMANVPDEAQFDLTQLYMVGKAVKRLRCTGLCWKLPPWPDFCAMICNRIAQHRGYEVLVKFHSVKQYNHSVLYNTDKLEELMVVYKSESMKMRHEVEEERKMLQRAEVWREERVQIKLVDAKLTLDSKYSQLNRLQSDHYGAGEAAAMCLMLAARLLYAEDSLISNANSEKAAEAIEDPRLVGMSQIDGTTAWSNNRTQVGGFSVGQVQEAEPLFHGAFEGPVTGLALDSMRIYSGSWDMTVCIWGRAQMKFVQKFMHADWVGSLAPHGNTIDSTTGTDAYLWDIGSGELTSIISNAYVGNAYSLARTHLPDVLFTRGEDGAIRLFSVYNVSNEDDINQTTTWVLHTSPVHSLVFEYPWLVSASCDGRISLMDLWKLLTPKSSSKHPFRVKSLGTNAIEPPQTMLHGFGCSLFSIDIGADRIVGGGDEVLVYTVTNEDRRPYRLSCSVVGSNKNDILMLEEPDESIYSNIRHTKDFWVITLNVFSDTHSKTVVESTGPKSWKNIFLKEPGVILEDVGFCDTHMVLILRQGRKLRLCSVNLPLPKNIEVPAQLSYFHPFDLPFPNHVCQILCGPNYDYYSSTMRFTISSLVRPDAVIDDNLLNGKWQTVQQQNMLHERTKVLYGNAFAASADRLSSNKADLSSEGFGGCNWNELNEYCACEYYYAPSKDGVLNPLTLVYSQKHKQEGIPGLLHGPDAYAKMRHQVGARPEQMHFVYDVVSSGEVLFDKEKGVKAVMPNGSTYSDFFFGSSNRKKIPSTLSNLQILTQLVFSYNHFSGSVPTFGQHVLVNITGNPDSHT